MTSGAESIDSDARHLRVGSVCFVAVCVIICSIYDYYYHKWIYASAGTVDGLAVAVRLLLSTWPIVLLFFARQRWMMVAVCVFYAVLASYVAYAFHVLVPDAMKQGYRFGWWLDYALILWGGTASAFVALWKVKTLF